MLSKIIYIIVAILLSNCACKSNVIDNQISRRIDRNDTLIMNLSSTKSIYNLNEDIVLKVTIINRSSNNIYIYDNFSPNYNLDIMIYNTAGTRIFPEHRITFQPAYGGFIDYKEMSNGDFFGREIIIKSSSKYKILPASRNIDDFDQEYYYLNKGKYKIIVVYSSMQKSDEIELFPDHFNQWPKDKIDRIWEGKLESNEITISIK